MLRISIVLFNILVFVGQFWGRKSGIDLSRGFSQWTGERGESGKETKWCKMRRNLLDVSKLVCFFSLWWRKKGKKVMNHLFSRLFRSSLPWNSSQKKISFLWGLFDVFSMHVGAFCLDELRESDASG